MVSLNNCRHITFSNISYKEARFERQQTEAQHPVPRVFCKTYRVYFVAVRTKNEDFNSEFI